MRNDSKNVDLLNLQYLPIFMRINFQKNYCTCPNLLTHYAVMNEGIIRPRLSSILHEICKLLQHQVLLCKFSQTIETGLTCCYRRLLGLNLIQLLGRRTRLSRLPFASAVLSLPFSVERCGSVLNCSLRSSLIWPCIVCRYMPIMLADIYAADVWAEVLYRCIFPDTWGLEMYVYKQRYNTAL